MSVPKTFCIWLPEAYRERIKKIQRMYYAEHQEMPSKASVLLYGLHRLDPLDFVDNYKETRNGL